MGKRVQFFLGAAGLLLVLGLFLARGGENTAVIRADDPDEMAHLPAIFDEYEHTSPSPTPEETPEPTDTPEPTLTPEPTVLPQELVNPSFEDENWTDVDDDKQQPPGWELTWVEKDEPLYDSSDLASGSCECVHKFGRPGPGGLPPDEWLGRPNALVLEGDATYKLFRADTAWGSQLSQTILLPANSEWRVSVPVQIHSDPRGGGFDAESSVWVNDEGGWANIDGMGDHQWCTHTREFTAPADGQVRIDIRFKSKFLLTQNFFIDDVRLVPAGAPDPHPGIGECALTAPLDTYEPYRP